MLVNGLFTEFLNPSEPNPFIPRDYTTRDVLPLAYRTIKVLEQQAREEEQEASEDETAHTDEADIGSGN